MKRNTDRMWYDRGYRLGVVETKRDAVWPRLIGYASVLVGAHYEPLWTLLFLLLYAAFELSNWRDRCEESDHRREHDTPGDRYEQG